MQEKHLRKLKIRRGNDNQRKSTLFEEGELVFVKDTERVFVGDDATLGGNKISNKNFIIESSVKPLAAESGDIFLDQTDTTTYMVDLSGGTIKIIGSLAACCVNVKKDIDIIDALLKRLSNECCNPDNYLATDLDSIIFSDNILLDNTDTINV